MALANQFFSNIGDDPFGPSIPLRRDTFPQWCDLRDSHNSVFLLDELDDDA